MSRTPKREIHKLPLWVQQEITRRDNEISRLLDENERLEAFVVTLEETNEELAKRGEENARLAFENTVVDL